jgi:hypothetical protein
MNVMLSVTIHNPKFFNSSIRNGNAADARISEVGTTLQQLPENRNQ